MLTLRFRLPIALRLCVPVGRWGPCLHQARVDVGNEHDVEIRAENGLESEARRIAFEQARRFLTAIAGGRDQLLALPPQFFPARLRSSLRPERVEDYSIITGAAVSITRALERPFVS